MAFDIFLQRFSAGEPASANAGEVRAVLDAHVVELEQGRARVETADGGASLYGYDDLERGFMVNHAAGNIIWDILVTVASVGPYVIMPTGCPACATDESMLADLPSRIAAGAKIVSSGNDLLRAIKG